MARKQLGHKLKEKEWIPYEELWSFSTIYAVHKTLLFQCLPFLWYLLTIYAYFSQIGKTTINLCMDNSIQFYSEPHKIGTWWSFCFLHSPKFWARLACFYKSYNNLYYSFVWKVGFSVQVLGAKPPCEWPLSLVQKTATKVLLLTWHKFYESIYQNGRRRHHNHTENRIHRMFQGNCCCALYYEARAVCWYWRSLVWIWYR